MSNTTPTSLPSPRAPRRFARLRGLALGVVLGIGGGALGMQLGKWAGLQAPPGSSHLALSPGERVALIVVVLLALHLTLLAHELGHLLGGRLVGFRAFLLIVGPIRLERGASGWHLHLNTNLGLWGGLAGSAPVDTSNLRRRSAAMIAAGPLTSIAAGFAGMALWWWLDPTGLNAATPFPMVLLSFSALAIGASSLAIAVATLLPIQTSGFLSDGARLLRLLRDGPLPGRDTALQTIISQSLGGVRPRDWPADLITQALTVRDGSMFEFSAWQFAQLRALDLGQAAEAADWLQQMLDGVHQMPPTLQPHVRLEAARQLAIRGELAAAEQLFAEAKGPVLFGPYVRPLAQATLLAASGRDAEARALLPGIRAQLAASIDRGTATMLLEAVDRIETHARQTASAN